MKIKKFLSKSKKRTYLKGESTNKIKEKAKKFKNILKKEAKHTIEKTRSRESIYTPLEDNAAVQATVTENNAVLRTKKHEGKKPSVERKSYDAHGVVHESDIDSTEEKKIDYEHSECGEELDQSVRRLKKKKKKKIPYNAE